MTKSRDLDLGLLRESDRQVGSNICDGHLRSWTLFDTPGLLAPVSLENHQRGPDRAISIISGMSQDHLGPTGKRMLDFPKQKECPKQPPRILAPNAVER
jgi:hypothetical protein